MQGQRYAPGQHFRAHHDYFHESEYYWQRMKNEGGQRTWTAMIYLNDVAEGGATWFPTDRKSTSELQSLMRISYAVFCLKKKKLQKSLISHIYQTHIKVTNPTPAQLHKSRTHYKHTDDM